MSLNSIYDIYMKSTHHTHHATLQFMRKVIPIFADAHHSYFYRKTIPSASSDIMIHKIKITSKDTEIHTYLLAYLRARIEAVISAMTAGDTLQRAI